MVKPMIYDVKKKRKRKRTSSIIGFTIYANYYNNIIILYRPTFWERKLEGKHFPSDLKKQPCWPAKSLSVK